MTTRVALIGCGRWGRNIARVLSRLGALKVIVDPAGEALRSYADELGSELTTDISQAFGPDIDAVAIAAPAVDHARLVLEALSAGKHVYVEKPLALRVADAQRCADAADKAGKTLMIGHLLQYHPAFQTLKKLVAEGAIGEVRHITSNRLNPGMIRTEENALWSMAPHDFSMVLALADGEPWSVAGLPVQVLPTKTPDQFHALLHFDTMSASVNVSWLSPYKEHKLTVLGTTGALVFEDTAATRERKLVIFRDYIDRSSGQARFVKQEGEPVPFPDGEPLENEMRTFLDCAATGAVSPTGPHEAIPVLRLLTRADA